MLPRFPLHFRTFYVFLVKRGKDGEVCISLSRKSPSSPVGLYYVSYTRSYKLYNNSYIIQCTYMYIIGYVFNICKYSQSSGMFNLLVRECSKTNQLVSFGGFTGEYWRKPTQPNTTHTTIQQPKKRSNSLIKICKTPDLSLSKEV